MSKSGGPLKVLEKINCWKRERGTENMEKICKHKRTPTCTPCLDFGGYPEGY